MNEVINSKRNNWRIIILIIVLGSISLLIYRFGLAKETPVKTDCEGPEIQMFRTQLALIPSSDSQQRENVQGKIKAWETMIAVCENNTPVIGVTRVMPTSIPETPQPFATGIFEGQTGDYHSFEAKIENHWQGIVNGNRVTVFAGAWVSDPSQGFISVKISSNKGPAVWSYHPSVTKSGALCIVDVKDSRLMIQQANDKKSLYFDVPALSFVSSFDATVVPVTSTIPPTLTITPSSMGDPYPLPINSNTKTYSTPYPLP